MIQWINIKRFLDLRNVKLQFKRVNVFLCDCNNVAWTSLVLEAVVLPTYLKTKYNLHPIEDKYEVETNLFKVRESSNSCTISTKRNYSAIYMSSPDLHIFRKGNLNRISITDLITLAYEYCICDSPEKIVSLDNVRGLELGKANYLSEHIGAFSKKQFFISSFNTSFLFNLLLKTPKKSLRVFYGDKVLTDTQIENILDLGSCALLNLKSIVSS